MAYYKVFDEAKASKRRKEFPTRTAGRLGKSPGVKHTGAYAPVCSIHCFRVSWVLLVSSQAFYWHTCVRYMLKIYEVVPTLVCKLVVLSSVVLHLKQNISISSENR